MSIHFLLTVDLWDIYTFLIIEAPTTISLNGEAFIFIILQELWKYMQFKLLMIISYYMTL